MHAKYSPSKYLYLKYVCLIMFMLLSVSGTSYSQTTIPPGDVSGLWDITGSPYSITGDITVPNAQTLTIEPGVVVNFQGYYTLAVQGRLLAEGTENDTIFFTAENTTEGWRGIRFVNTQSSNDTSKFYYCYIRYGTNMSGTGDNALGGGMFIRNFAKVHVSHSYFSDNRARWGGGIQCRENAHIIIEHSTFTNNYAEFSGAAIRAIDFSDPVIRFNRIHHNNSGGGGAAIYFYRSDAVVLSNLIYNNTATSSGGAVSMDNSRPSFINNLFINNTATNGGAMHFTTLSHAKVINNTFSGNSATNGGALYFSLSSNPDFYNSIFWGNTSPFGSQVYIHNDNSDPNFYHCIMQFGIIGFVGPGAAGNYTGTYVNNIESNPLFDGTGEHPFSLLSNSPAIDAGAPDTTGFNLPIYDLAGNPRISNSIVDIGAYEFPHLTNINESALPEIFVLEQNFPNPFNPSTVISWQSPIQSHQTLKVYDMLGREVVTLVNEVLPEGRHEVVFDASGLASGIYFYCLEAKSKVSDKHFTKVGKMVLLK